MTQKFWAALLVSMACISFGNANKRDQIMTDSEKEEIQNERMKVEIPRQIPTVYPRIEEMTGHEAKSFRRRMQDFHPYLPIISDDNSMGTMPSLLINVDAFEYKKKEPVTCFMNKDKGHGIRKLKQSLQQTQEELNKSQEKIKEQEKEIQKNSK